MLHLLAPQEVDPTKIYVNEFIDFSASKLLFIDTETTGKDRFSTIGGIGIMDERGVGTYLAYGHKLGENLDKQTVLEYCRNLFSDPEKIYVFFHAKFDIGMFLHDDVHIAGEIRDAMIYASLLDETRFSYKLKVLAKQDLGMAPEEKDKLTKWLKANGYKDWEVLKAPVSLAAPYCYGDILRTKGLYDLYYPQIESSKWLNAVAKTECLLVPALAKSELKGICVNVELLKQDKIKYSIEIADLLSEIQKLVGVKIFNPLSPLHLEQYFIKKELKIFRTAKNELQFDKNALRKTIQSVGASNRPDAKEIIEVLNKVLRMRDRNTVLTTFIDKYLELQIDGVIYPSFNALRGEKGGAITGRMSCDSPNMQNVKNPKKDKESGEVVDGGARKYFQPRPGKVFVSVDYSQIEYRIFAHYSGDKQLINAYIKNPWIDFHQMIADMMGVPRKYAKSINFGLLYAMGKKHLAEALGFDPNDPEELEEANRLFNEYHNKFPSIKKLRDEVERVMRERGYIRNLFGRYRHIGPPVGGNRDERYKSLNSLIQGCAADLLKVAIVRANEVCEKLGYVDMLLYVHDEIVFELAPDKIEEFLNVIIPVMQDFQQLSVPVRVDTEVFDKDWADGKEWKQAA